MYVVEVKREKCKCISDAKYDITLDGGWHTLSISEGKDLPKPGTILPGVYFVIL